MGRTNYHQFNLPARKRPPKVARLDYRTNNYFSPTPKNNDQSLHIPVWTIYLTLIVMAILLIIWFFTRAPWLMVKDIKIDGEPTSETLSEIEKLRGRNILWLSVTRPEEVILKKQPNLSQIQILRGIPDTLKVKLIERQPALIWQVRDWWYTLDSTGFIFKSTQLTRRSDGSIELPSTDLPIVVDTKELPVEIGKTVVLPRFINFMSDLRARLPKESNLDFVRAELGETSYSATVVTSAGWQILFDTTRSLDAQLRTVNRVLETKRSEIKDYLDVRVRGWVYYK